MGGRGGGEGVIIMFFILEGGLILEILWYFNNNNNNSNILLVLLVNTKKRKEIKVYILAKGRAPDSHLQLANDSRAKRQALRRKILTFSIILKLNSPRYPVNITFQGPAAQLSHIFRVLFITF